MVQFKSFPLFRLLVLIAECDYVLAGLNVVMHCGRHGFSQRSHCRLRLLSSTTSTVTTTVNFTSVDSNPVIDLSRPNPSVAKLPTPHPTTSATATSAVVKTTSSLYSSPKPTARPLTPNNIKAGIAGGDAYPFLKDHIGWWYDWSPNPSKAGTPVGVPMLWGGGTADAQDAARLRQFQQISQAPPFVLGFEEPDCASGDGSAGMSVEDGVSKWESLIAPLSKKGTKLGSPSMCKQADETWLSQFSSKISTPWDFTAIHINKNSLAGVKLDIEHYISYGKPIWVTEFACVDDFQGFRPCTDQDEIDGFINDVVPYFQAHPNVYAYAYSNGLGLGDVWPLMSRNSLSESGKTYLAAISKYH
ncbi:glycoside hydrolase family 128 protein [Laccaria amethystina LaAM-08-1]|uniref:Glycoside hydrolase family 128 protein n=1 Tax=Laccaria amethystina LaAM-08-1 TaxID=1095629 RepID=A0A0C9WP36_9AGAR|nr:glycoside hydrolase family 128 protein [Laccaria amethystina LaAM-08-1]